MSATTVEFPQSLCRAGVARVDITPPVGIYHRMWGAATHDRSTGVHRPLTATVLVLGPPESESREELLFTIAVDHCLLWQTEMTNLLETLCEGVGIAREQVVVFFSHTHAAGLMGHERQEFQDGVDGLCVCVHSDPRAVVPGTKVAEPTHLANGQVCINPPVLYTRKKTSHAEEGRYACPRNKRRP